MNRVTYQNDTINQPNTSFGFCLSVKMLKNAQSKSEQQAPNSFSLNNLLTQLIPYESNIVYALRLQNCCENYLGQIGTQFVNGSFFFLDPENPPRQKHTNYYFLWINYPPFKPFSA